MFFSSLRRDARGRGLALRRASLALVAFLGLSVIAAGCGQGDGPAATSGSPSRPGAVKVVATTTILADLVREAGGDAVDVTQVLPANADAHDYEPRPKDIADTSDAQLVVRSGDGLDRWIEDVVTQSGTDAPTLDVSKQLRVRLPGEKEGDDASRFDPHWWHDPRNTSVAVREIRDALSVAAPDARTTYEQNTTAYLTKLETLDRGIETCFARVPAAQRKLVSDHDAFNYFTDRYDITTVGAVIPAQTTQAQASAGELAALAGVIEAEGVKAVFPQKSVSSRVVDAIARQTGASADFELYGDSLGAEGTPGDTYLGMMQANADAMVRGFTDNRASCPIADLDATVQK